MGQETATLLPGQTGGLERLCDSGARIRFAPGASGIERLEAHFHGHAFSPHRHDTYAIGITLAGLQTFRFRGEQWHCLPGQCHILHPDETHDGGAGTDEGFGYRIVYLDPRLVQDALGARSLPFVAKPVVDAARLRGLGTRAIWDFNADLDDMTQVELVAAAANLLAGASGARCEKAAPLAFGGLSRVRGLIAASPAQPHAMQELERLSGLDRWTLARQFRAAFGTSPSRFRTMRQLDHVRRLLLRGAPLAEAAIEAGFADQSHMSRRFKSAYGLTPGDWASLAVKKPP